MNKELMKKYEDCFGYLPHKDPYYGFDGYFAIVDNSNNLDLVNFINFQYNGLIKWKYTELEKLNQSMKILGLTYNSKCKNKNKILELQTSINRFQSEQNELLKSKDFKKCFVESNQKEFEEFIFELHDTTAFTKSATWAWKNWYINLKKENQEFIFKDNPPVEQSIKLFLNHFLKDIFETKSVKRVRVDDEINHNFNYFFNEIYYLWGKTFIIEYENDTNLYIFCIGEVD